MPTGVRKTGRKSKRGGPGGARASRSKSARAPNVTATVRGTARKLGARARAAGTRLVSKVKGMSGKKLATAAATAVGLGVAAVGAVVASRRRRKRRNPFHLGKQ
jgi:hypothetical protein